MKNTPSKKILLFFSFLFLGAIFLGATCEFSTDGQSTNKNTSPNANVVQEAASQPAAIPVFEYDYNYENDEYGFQLYVPEAYEITETPGEQYEFTVFYRPDPEQTSDLGHGGMDPNSAKVALSWRYPEGGASAMEYLDNEIGYDPDEMAFEEVYIDDNYTGYRYYYDTDMGPVIDYYIEYPDGSLLQIIGYYGQGGEMETLVGDIYDIQSSFLANK